MLKCCASSKVGRERNTHRENGRYWPLAQLLLVVSSGAHCVPCLGSGLCADCHSVYFQYLFKLSAQPMDSRDPASIKQNLRDFLDYPLSNSSSLLFRQTLILVVIATLRIYPHFHYSKSNLICYFRVREILLVEIPCCLKPGLGR